MKKFKNTVKFSGFTLIELLIVIAILGVLAVVVLVAINPVQQLARTRDSGRKSTITQLGRILQAYYTARGQFLPQPSDNNWLSALVTAGEIPNPPAAIAYNAASALSCGTGASNQNGFCYHTAGGTSPNSIVVYTSLESTAERSKCIDGTGTQLGTWYVYSSANGASGIFCSNTAPTPGSPLTLIQ